MKYGKKLTVALLSFLALNLVDAQDTTIIKFGKGNALDVISPAERHTMLKDYIIPLVPIGALILSLLSIISSLRGIRSQIATRREDEKSKNQLDRLSKQITEFYGPLYSLYETGHQNYYAFLKLYGDEFYFSNPNFKPWNDTIFQHTNSDMEKIIITKADLILGNHIPDFLLQFCKFYTAQKAYSKAETQNNFDNTVWKSIVDSHQHPKDEMRMYLKASFEVLKETQSKILTRKQLSYNEEELAKEIELRKNEYKAIGLTQYEQDVWLIVESKKAEADKIREEKEAQERANAKLRKEAFQKEEELIARSKIPEQWKVSL